MSETHYIGASADGTAPGAVVEIKCPSRGTDKTVAELINSGYEHLSVGDDGNMQLKESSHYYCQVQGEMAIKGYKLCHFVVWTPCDIEVVSVYYNETFWNDKLLPKLKLFFDTVIRPELLTDVDEYSTSESLPFQNGSLRSRDPN